MPLIARPRVSFLMIAATLLMASALGARAQGLVAAYGFDEGTGTTVADVSGNGNDGTLLNTVWTAGGKFGSALVFNGTSARIAIPDSNSLDLASAMTIEAWVYPTAVAAWERFVDLSKGQANDNIIFSRNGSSNELFLQVFLWSDSRCIPFRLNRYRTGSDWGRYSQGEAPHCARPWHWVHYPESRAT